MFYKISKYKDNSLMEFLLMAAFLHLGPESLPALGELAGMGMVGHVLPLLGLILLLMLELHVAAELARADEPLVDPSSLAGGTDVPFLLGLDHHLPLVSSLLVTPEVVSGGEAVSTMTSVSNLLMDTEDVPGEAPLLPEAAATGSTFEGLDLLVNGSHVTLQVGLLGKGLPAARQRAGESRALIVVSASV